MEKSAAKHKKNILMLQILFLLAMGAVILTGFYFDFELESLIYSLCLFLMLEFTLVVCSWYTLSQKLFSPYILFMFSAFMFNGGQAFLEVFGMNETKAEGNPLLRCRTSIWSAWCFLQYRSFPPCW